MTTDWTVLEIEGVMEVAERAARKVARQYENTTEREDMLQEAVIRLATQPEQARAALEGGGLGRLHHWLWCDLVDMVKTEAGKRTRHVSHEVLIERVAVDQ